MKPTQHPIDKSALIPIIITHPDGTSQTYWISLKRFMEERNKGTNMQRIPSKKHESVIDPGKEAEPYESEFIENFAQFKRAGLKIKDDTYEIEMVAEVKITKNGKVISTLPLKLDKEQIARESLKKIMGT